MFGIASALLWLAFTSACSSSEVALTSPSAAKCHVTVANSLDVAPAAGASGSLAVTTTRDCTWAASSAGAWVVITSPSNGQGDGSIAYRVAANADPARRQTTIEVNDTQVAIAQDAAECRFTVSPEDATAPAEGATISVHVQPSANCGWTAATDAPWIHITAGASGTGAGSVTVSVDRNTGGARSAVVTIAGQSVRVTQADGGDPATPPPGGQPCSYAILPGGQTVAASGGSGSLTVTSGPACAWTAVSNADWLAITSGASGTGNGTVGFSIAANGGGSRTGTISVAGQTFTVTQSALACTYTISPAADAVTAAGGTITVTVTAGGACGWVAASDVPWITVSSGATGSGNGTVNLSVAPNSGSPRSGTATIAGRTFTVSQAAPACSYSLSPSLIDVPSGGGAGSTTVSAGAGCAWTASSNAPWIRITSATSGTGNGSVTFAADANSGPARSGTITIGGQTLTITQPAPCTFTIAPTSQSLPSAGGTGSVGVTAPNGCAWTAQSNNPDWLSISAGSSGNGAGSVSFTASPNTGAARTGTLTIAGQTFTVSEDAPCAFTIAPTAQTMPAAGGTGSVSVSTGSTCAWTATSNNADWLTVSAGASGTGPGTVTFSAAANPGPDRTGTIAIAGQTFSLTETAP